MTDETPASPQTTTSPFTPDEIAERLKASTKAWYLAGGVAGDAIASRIQPQEITLWRAGSFRGAQAFPRRVYLHAVADEAGSRVKILEGRTMSVNAAIVLFVVLVILFVNAIAAFMVLGFCFWAEIAFSKLTKNDGAVVRDFLTRTLELRESHGA